jgi:hypothetical protein
VLISTVRVLEVSASNMRLLLCTFLLFIFTLKVFVFDYNIIHIFWFTLVYIFIFKVNYVITIADFILRIVNL